jgi:hypothetical protein
MIDSGMGDLDNSAVVGVIERRVENNLGQPRWSVISERRRRVSNQVQVNECVVSIQAG